MAGGRVLRTGSRGCLPLGPGRSTFGSPNSDGELWVLIDRPTQGDQASPARLAVCTDAGRIWKGTASIPGSGSAGHLARVSQRGEVVVSESTAGGRLCSALVETTDGGPSWQRLAGPCGSLPGQQLSAVDASHLWLTCGSEPAGSLQAKSVCFSADAADAVP